MNAAVCSKMKVLRSKSLSDVHIHTDGANCCPADKAAEGTLHLCPFLNAYSGSLLTRNILKCLRIIL
jgi:hypothetical protein